MVAKSARRMAEPKEISISIFKNEHNIIRNTISKTKKCKAKINNCVTAFVIFLPLKFTSVIYKILD